ncbi:hypothetical protein [Saccharopolyspora shandongensis]|uniref:hypothetical protein n=1 Tax=Saccharopolyspora shandongensis TaxID=418495 RepID=UPI0033EC8931
MKNTTFAGVLAAVLAGVMFGMGGLFSPDRPVGPFMTLAPWVLGGMLALMSIALLTQRSRM